MLENTIQATVRRTDEVAGWDSSREVILKVIELKWAMSTWNKGAAGNLRRQGWLEKHWGQRGGKKEAEPKLKI